MLGVAWPGVCVCVCGGCNEARAVCMCAFRVAVPQVE